MKKVWGLLNRLVAPVAVAAGTDVIAISALTWQEAHLAALFMGFVVFCLYNPARFKGFSAD